MLPMSPRLVLFVGLLLLSFLSFWDFLGWHTCCRICLNLRELQSVFQRPKRINFKQKYLYFLRTHGRVRPIQIPCAWTQSSWSERSCPTSTTRAAVLSSMVWAHADGHLAIAEDVTASVSTSVPSSVQLASEIHPWVRSLPRSLVRGPIHGFHQHLLHLLHPLWHINFQVANLLHRAHQQCHVHPLKWHRPALLPFLRPSLVKLALHMWTHQGVTQRLTTAASMDLIPILIGKRTKITTTIRRSTAWLFLVAFVNQPSRKNWTLKDVILWNYQWRPCCISRPTTFGFGSWLMGVKSTWFRLGTLQLLCSWRSSWLNSATRG